MSNVYPIGQDGQYLIRRAAKNRRAGNFEQAMMLLSRANALYSDDEDVVLELAKTYDEMGCEEEAECTYLRLVRMEGRYRPLALFELALSSAQRADLERSASYYEAFAASDRSGVSHEMAQLLGRQLAEAIYSPHPKGKRARAKALEQKAIKRLNVGKVHAARRNAQRACALFETPQRHLLMACCHLVRGEGRSAVVEAKRALEMKPVYVQALCLLADAYMLLGEKAAAKTAIFLAARQARANDSLLSVAIESAKYGYDQLTLIVTKRLIKRDPYHIRALAMRACALMNLGKKHQAAKLFGRLCTLLPQNSIYEAYYQLAKDGGSLPERLTAAQDVTVQESMERSFALMEILGEEPEKLRASDEEILRVCRLARWALYSHLAGPNVKTVAVIILAALDMPRTREVLFAALVDPAIDDQLKQSILQAASAHCDQMPMYADLQGRLVRLAAGICIPSGKKTDAMQTVVQQAANALMHRYPDAVEALLEMWSGYIQVFGAPAHGRAIDACSAALEYAYHLQNGRKVSRKKIAFRYGISCRLMNCHVRRILHAVQAITENQQTK